ncbi:hypothetical protein Nmel_000453 [Mimus melanotis]
MEAVGSTHSQMCWLHALIRTATGGLNKLMIYKEFRKFLHCFKLEEQEGSTEGLFYMYCQKTTEQGKRISMYICSWMYTL